MKTRSLLIVLCALAVLGGVFGFWYMRNRDMRAAMAGMARPPATVTTTEAKQDTWRDQLNAVASLESHRGITVAAEVAGRISRVAFDSGASVNAGDLLVELDVTTELAQLDGLEAAAQLAEINLARARDLRAKGSNSQSDLDTAEANEKQARAAVAELRSQIAKKRIVAPFGGRLGITQVHLGQYVKAGDPLVILESVDPMYVDFGLPQQDIGRLAPGLEVRLSVDAFPGRTFVGKVETVNPRISTETRNVRIRAAIPNAGELLQPGMFGQVAVMMPEARDVVVVPSTSVVYTSYGDSVYVVTGQPAGEGTAPQLAARQRFVTVGPMRGDLVSIIQGLEPGERVVTAGQIKLRNGAPVRIDNSITPSSDAAPTPSES